MKIPVIENRHDVRFYGLVLVLVFVAIFYSINIVTDNSVTIKEIQKLLEDRTAVFNDIQKQLDELKYLCR